MSKKVCCVCGQKTDIYTDVHKKAPFVDGKNYPAVCFTCYFVPRTYEQKYGKDGNIEEEKELPYSCEHLNSPKDLYDQGASDSIKYAKACVEAVQNACKGVKPPKKPTFGAPKPSWNVC